MSAYNYVVSAQKPTNVTHAVMGNFTAPDAYNLIVAKCTRIEIHTLNEEGLQAAFDMPIFGRIATMTFWRPSSEKRDLLCAAPSMPCPCVVRPPPTKALAAAASSPPSATSFACSPTTK